MADHNRVWIIDFGSQYTQLIARRVRELAVLSEIVLPAVTAEEIRRQNISALILSGGPASVYAQDAPQIDPAILDLDIPVLGICYGLQLLIRYRGGRVHSDNHREYGRSRITIRQPHPLFAGIDNPTTVWMSHGDHVDSIPDGFETIAFSEDGAPAAIVDTGRPQMGLQFHPEVVHTTEGQRILAAFLFGVAHLKADWTAQHFIAESIAKIRARVGHQQVILGLSGGVDSSVMAVLMNQAIGRQCIPVFIDNGLLRLNEHQQVIRQLRQLGVRVRSYNFSTTFLDSLAGVTDPERKRKIIGRVFIRVFEKIARRYPGAAFLAQGTLYPDVIESRSVRGPSQVIKSHHNVGGLPKRMKLELVEPFNNLFKDEVRLIGHELGLADDIIYRHPFPGPGLAVRIIGAVTRHRLRLLREADAIFIEELKRSGEYRRVWQAFVVLIPVKTVGVMGDQRTYEQVVALRSVNSSDGMTADWSRLPDELLSRVANRIVNQIRGINRVVYDISSKPPGTIEWE